MPIMFIDEKIKGIDIQIKNIETINDRLQQEILAFIATDTSNPLIVSYKHQMATNFRNIAELCSKKSSLFKDKFKAFETCLNVIIQDMTSVYESLPAVLLMARKELNFPINEAEYNSMLARSGDTALVDLRNLINEVKAEIRKKMSERE